MGLHGFLLLSILFFSFLNRPQVQYHLSKRQLLITFLFKKFLKNLSNLSANKANDIGLFDAIFSPLQAELHSANKIASSVQAFRQQILCSGSVRIQEVVTRGHQEN